ncbi:hypothetical protein AHT46_20140 [Salmonella enterica]|uniref:Uncharacterized protein n=1 Tax=Salmonella enterica TaxID=28901 RepID=A0A3V8I4R3_SALER|nr:hypothetical protein ELZ76_00165 [Salmonella enterica subsp. salamae serovar 42:r:-]EAA9058782.1 hypothetical protein [Salmonella enterica]ECC3551960.1 hypothetical protein [Salmonella enterica subsp. salamae]AZT48880.1 hypothetical protein EL003_00175 [Salmonella enterica subsp. salamae serovar 42:r:-]AZT53099.1 hypothetical protein EL009_00165 [Salmonella enterica subsp. salamae serovar 42:r:-]
MLVPITLVSAFIEGRYKKKSRSVTGAARVIRPGFNTKRRPDNAPSGANPFPKKSPPAVVA